MKVAAKQKESNKNVQRQKQQLFSLNTTQVLEEQLLKLKLMNNNQVTIPQKVKVKSKSKGQLSGSNVQTENQPH